MPADQQRGFAMKAMIHTAAVLATVFSAVWMVESVFAEEPQKGWKGNVEGGYIQTDGNNDSKTFSVAGKAEGDFGFGKLTASGNGLYGKSKDQKTGVTTTSNKNWLGNLKYDQNLTERSYLFASETVERDTLKGIEIRYSHQGGLGYYLMKSDHDTLKVEAGAGYVNEHPVKPNRNKGYPAARGYGEFVHNFTEKTRFEQWVEYLPNLKEGKDYVIREESALITNLMGQFALKASFLVVYDNLPPVTPAGTPGYQKSDRTFKTALIYTF
jgi:putative salt-induced outer membrane protein